MRACLALLCLLLLAGTAAAEATSRATVQNAPPTLLTWDLASDGANHTYRVVARDDNGVEDLRTATFRFTLVGRTEPHLHVDARPEPQERIAVVWSGTVALPAPAIGVVTLEVVDVAGAVVSDTRVLLPPVAGGELVPSARPAAPTISAFTAAIVTGVLIGSSLSPVDPFIGAAASIAPTPSPAATTIAAAAFLGLALTTRIPRRP